MNRRFWTLLATLTLSVTVAGCRDGSTGKPKSDGDAAKAPGKGDGPTSDKTGDAASNKANLAKLSPEDRKLAEQQGFCAVETKNALGSMGVPLKIMIRGEPVFLCCDACETRARAHADRTLERVKQLREKNAGTPEK
jgi:hypothetical protein